MRLERRVLRVAATGVLVLVMAAVGFETLPAEATQKRLTLQLAETRGGAPCVSQLDINNDGIFNGGDTILENRCDLLDANGNRIGHYSTIVTVLGETADGPAGFVDCVVSLDGGNRLSFTGPGNFADVGTSGIDLVVTGGTGKYAGVGGEVNIVHVPGTPAVANFKLSR